MAKRRFRFELPGLARHRLLAALLAADFATKVAAFLLLPDGEPVAVMPGVRLYLALNEWGVMGGVHGLGTVAANPAYTMLLAFGLLLFAWTIVRLSASDYGFGARFAAGAAAFLGVAFASQALAAPLSHVSLPTDLLVYAIRLAVLAVAVAFYLGSRAPVARAAFALLAAGALGNAGSYLYPPFQVVDFLVVPLEPLRLFLGAGAAAAGEAAVGVINLADVYLFVFPLMLLAWPVAATAGRLRRRG